MNKIKKTVTYTLTNPLEASLAVGYYIITASVAVWGVMFALKLGRAIIIGY